MTSSGMAEGRRRPRRTEAAAAPGRDSTDHRRFPPGRRAPARTDAPRQRRSTAGLPIQAAPSPHALKAVAPAPAAPWLAGAASAPGDCSERNSACSVCGERTRLSLQAATPHKQKAPDFIRNQGLRDLVAWDCFEKTSATRANTHFSLTVLVPGYTFGYTRPFMAHRRETASVRARLGLPE